jgi:hypothetical protein
VRRKLTDHGHCAPGHSLADEAVTVHTNAGDGHEQITWLHATRVGTDALDLDVPTDVPKNGWQRLQEMMQSHVH